MENEKNKQQLLGLPDKATMEEMEDRCEILLEWLESDSIPEELTAWADHQADLVQDVYVSLSIPEGTGVGEELRVKAPRPKITEPAPGLSVAFGLPRIGGSYPVLVAFGLILGLIVVGGLWWSGVIFEGDDEGSAAPTEVSFDQDQFLAGQQERLDQLVGDLASNPEDVDILFELGETNMLGGNWDQAILWFTRLLELEPANIHAGLDVGTANMNLGRNVEAEAAFTNVLRLDPNEVQGHYNMGFLMAFRTDTPDLLGAVAHWREVIRLAPDSDLAQNAQLHIDQVQVPEAGATGEE